ncbi:MAG TPA: hypothetical protein VEZ11_09605 [Thermoanaerobaculia bacterium]|nr:hypothetical protein [Thermoanaerobaculia bacterium]
MCLLAGGELDDDQLKSLLRDSWSGRTSSLWSERNPSRGQCGVTALVINDHFGGEILKTRVGQSWHFYNRIGGRTLDLTSDQFLDPIEYLDLVSSREEALADHTEDQYRELVQSFAEAIANARR